MNFSEFSFFSAKRKKKYISATTAKDKHTFYQFYFISNSNGIPSISVSVSRTWTRAWTKSLLKKYTFSSGNHESNNSELIQKRSSSDLDSWLEAHRLIWCSTAWEAIARAASFPLPRLESILFESPNPEKILTFWTSSTRFSRDLNKQKHPVVYDGRLKSFDWLKRS